MKNTTTVKTKPAMELAAVLGFNGKYVDSLIKTAKTRGYQGETPAQILADYRRRQREEKKRQAAKFGLSVFAFETLRRKAWELLADFHTGHSMGCYRNLYVKTKDGVKEFRHRNRLDDYAKSCKWRPTYGSLSITLTAKELQEIRNIEGVWTITRADGSAKWLAEKGAKQSYRIEWTEGFCYGTSHSAKSLRDAKVLELRKEQAIALAAQNDKKFVGFEHLRRVGACQAGIEAFCRRHSLDSNMGYNLGFLKSLNDSTGKTYLTKI